MLADRKIAYLKWKTLMQMVGKSSSLQPLKILVKTKTREREVCEQRLSLQLSTSDRSSISGNSKGVEEERERCDSDVRSKKERRGSFSFRFPLVRLHPYCIRRLVFSRLFMSRKKPVDGQEKWVNYRVISPEK